MEGSCPWTKVDDRFPEWKDTSLHMKGAHLMLKKKSDKWFAFSLAHTYITEKFQNSKDKEKILKTPRDTESVTYKGIRIRLPSDFP